MNNSPGKLSHLYQQDLSDSFPNKYLSDHSHEYVRPELIKQHLQAEASSINATLGSLFQDRPRLGLLFSTDPYEVEKTIDVIKMLLSQRQKDLETKNQIFANHRRAEGEKSQMGAQLQKLQRDIKRVEADRESLIIKFKALEKSHKETTDRLSSEKEEWAKKYRGIEARQNQYINMSRKQEQTIKSLQDKVGRGLDKGAVRNSFEVVQQLQTYGPTFIMVNAEHEYNQMVAKTMEENYSLIANQNQYLKDTLQNIQRELQAVLQLKCEILRKRRGYDSQIDSAFEMTPLKPQLLNLPTSFSKQPVQALQQNVNRFKEAMRLGQVVDEKEADQKVTCVGNVKNLIRNYKNVIESQEQLLNRVVLKAKEFKSNEMQAIQSRNSKTMDEDEIQRARRFIQQQSNYLEGKNRELELTRRAMQTTMKKVEQEREEFARRSGQANEELSRVKRQIEMLPGMIEQELTGV